jgi:mRNA interferase MazF
MRRGEIRWVDLDPARGAESNNRRPAVIVSNDVANTAASRLGRGVVTVVPVTSNVERIHPFQTALSARATGLTSDSKAQAEQVRWVAAERIGALIGSLTGDDIAALDEPLRLHLAL